MIWAVIAQGTSASARKGAKSLASSSARPAGPAVARHVLDDGQHAGGTEAIAHGSPEVGDQRRIGAERSVADRFVSLRVREIQHRGAIGGEAASRQLVAQQAGV
jgi:hypothetical protein